MKKIILFLIVYTSFNFTFSQGFLPFIPPQIQQEEKSTVKQILKQIQDTIGIKQGELKVEDEKASIGKVKEYNPRKEDIDEKAGSEGNDKSKSTKSTLAPNKLLKDAAKASETVEKLTETATKELRENLDSVDIFGFDYFRRKDIKLFNNAVDVKPPLNYILGVGDQIVVSIWGYADYNRLFFIDKDGFIQQENVGRIYLKGLTFEQAKEVLRTRFMNAYMIEKSQFEVSLNYSRVVAINVVGDVSNPGTYTFPAINSAYNILAYVGGPTKTGTVRNIVVKRDGKVIYKFDLYKFLFEPEKQPDVFMNNNDYLYVPSRGKLVQIVGQVLRPHKYEMLENETLDDLLKYCGGYLPNAHTNLIQIKRYENNKLVLVDYNYDSIHKAKGKIELLNGDIVSVRAIPDDEINFVDIKGNVFLPGRYQLKPGDKIADLIKKAGGYRDDVLMEEAYLTRTFEDKTTNTFNINLQSIADSLNSDNNMMLKIRDVVEIFSKNYFRDSFSITISGNVRNPKRFFLEKQLSLKDAILFAGGVKENTLMEKIIIYRIQEDLNEKIMVFKIDSADNYQAMDTIKLRKRDRILVLRDPKHIDKYSIEVNGLVRSPGKFQYMDDMTLADAIVLCEGFKMEAASNRIEIARVSNFDKSISQSIPTQLTLLNYSVGKNISTDANAQKIKLQPYDQIFVRPTPEFEFQTKVKLSGEVVYPGEYVLLSKDEKISSLIERAGGLTRFAYANGAKLTRTNGGQGLVLLELDKALKRKTSKYNYIMKEGDELIVPTTKDLVTLKGAYNYPDTLSKPENLFVPFTNDKNANYYITNYGAGYAKNARKKGTYIIQPNGHVETRKEIVKKGATIVVPEKIKKVKNTRSKDGEGGEKLYKILNATIGTITSGLTLSLLLLTALKASGN